MWTRLLFVSLFLVAVSACDPKPFYGVTYSPLALDTNDICLPVEQVRSGHLLDIQRLSLSQVRKDMEIIATLSHSVRIYNIGVCYDFHIFPDL